MNEAKHKLKIGLIVNPYAGLGGRVGLKGSDGELIQNKALELGAVPESPVRAQLALSQITDLATKYELLTYAGLMGEEEALASGINPIVIGQAQGEMSTASDTEQAVRTLQKSGIGVLIFAGGDGTARNVYNALTNDIPIIGIPAGVKMHSAVYAISPLSAGKLARNFILGQTCDICTAEVMDIDENAFREGRVSARLYGYLTVPSAPMVFQGLKISIGSSAKTALLGMAEDIVERMVPGSLYIIGPGTTTRCLTELLKLNKTLLGTDLVKDKKLFAVDVNEKEILAAIASYPAQVIVTPIGGQGFIFGRGNQQISHRVLQKISREDIIVIATREKIASLEGRPLLVDSGSQDVDMMLSGFQKVLTGYRQEVLYKVSC